MNIVEDVAKISKSLMYKEAFYGLFLISLNKEYSEEIPTACVSKNGINLQITINPKYWNSLSDNHKEGLLKHELLHIAFQHLILMGNFLDKKLFNIAADIEVNQYLDPKTLHKDWYMPESFPNLHLGKKLGTKAYYDILNKNKDKDQNVQNALANMSGGHSEHILWKEFSELDEVTKNLVQQQLNYQLKDINESIKSRGTVPGEMKDIIDGLYLQKPPIFDWKGFLRRYLSNSGKIYTKKSRRKLNRRFVGLPAIKIHRKSKILVAVDTSGSVSNKELLDFFIEIRHIWKTGCSVDIVECDAKIYPKYEYKGVFSGKVTGRGGTSFQPVIDFYNEHKKEYNTLVYFTDGECSVPTTPHKTMLWVISSNASDGISFDKLPHHKIRIPKA